MEDATLPWMEDMAWRLHTQHDERPSVSLNYRLT